jgi:hypothetical protein
VAAINGFLLGWTALGLVLGAGFYSLEAERPAGGLGSPNLFFTAAITGAAAFLLAAITFVRGRLSWPLAAMAAAAVLSFGWLLPWLALRG